MLWMKNSPDKYGNSQHNRSMEYLSPAKTDKFRELSF